MSNLSKLGRADLTNIGWGTETCVADLRTQSLEPHAHKSNADGIIILSLSISISRLSFFFISTQGSPDSHGNFVPFPRVDYTSMVLVIEMHVELVHVVFAHIILFFFFGIFLAFARQIVLKACNISFFTPAAPVAVCSR